MRKVEESSGIERFSISLFQRIFYSGIVPSARQVSKNENRLNISGGGESGKETSVARLRF